MVFNYTLKIDGTSKAEADKIAEALNTLYKQVRNEDLLWVANKIKEDPRVISKVIKIANNPLVKNLW